MEMIIFKHQRKNLDGDIKIKLSKKILYHSQSVKYLGIKIVKNLNWEHRANEIAVKLNRVNAVLLKIRNFVNIDTLKIFYSAIFAAHTDYAKFKCLKYSIYFFIKSFENHGNQPQDCHSNPLFLFANT